MALSLQEQLLNAGLADKKKAGQIKREKHKKVKAKQKQKAEFVDESKVAAQQALDAKKAKDRELSAQAKKVAEKKEIAAQVKQLISINKQEKNNGDVACNFTDGTVIKRLFVNTVTHGRITSGKLAIVKDGEAYELVPMKVADKIAERVPEVVLYRADRVEDSTSTSEEDDWYADYEIPDDLTW